MTTVFTQQNALPLLTHPKQVQQSSFLLSVMSSEGQQEVKAESNCWGTPFFQHTCKWPLVQCRLSVNRSCRCYPGAHTATKQRHYPHFHVRVGFPSAYLPIYTYAIGDSLLANTAPNHLDLPFPIFLQLWLIFWSDIACLLQDLIVILHSTGWG